MDNELFNAVCFLEMMDYFDAQKKKATAEFQANVQRRNAARRQVQQEISQNASLIQTSTEAYLKKAIQQRDTVIAELAAENERLSEIIVQLMRQIENDSSAPKAGDSRIVAKGRLHTKNKLTLPVSIGFLDDIPAAPDITQDKEKGIINARNLELMPTGITRRLSKFPKIKTDQQKATYAVVYIGIANQDMLLANVIINLVNLFSSITRFDPIWPEVYDYIRAIPVLTTQEKEYLLKNIEVIIRKKGCFAGYSPANSKTGANAFAVLESSPDFQTERAKWIPAVQK